MLTVDDLIDSQRVVYEKALENIKNKKNFVISGPAGTGKTLITKFIYDELIKNFNEDSIFVAAPTHAAKDVLNKTIGAEKAATIHSILKINPETFEDVVEFMQNEMPDFDEAKVLLCDEASMYGSELFKILMNTVPDSCVIVGIGDVHQLAPVERSSGDNFGQEPEISRFFVSDAFERLDLTEVIRNSGGIIEVATEIRNGGDLRHNYSISEGGVYHAKNIKDFMQNYFKIVRKPDDFLVNRILAYKNKTVDTFNRIARKNILRTEKPYILGEVLVMQGPVSIKLKIKGKNVSKILLNNGERVKILWIDEESRQDFQIPNSGTVHTINYWTMRVRSIDNPTSDPVDINVIVEQHEHKEYRGFMNLFASACRAQVASGRRQGSWEPFWKITELFSKVKPVAACTIHKSQGTTNENTFLYTQCMYEDEMHQKLEQQLKYVGVTRSKKSTFFM